MMLNLRTSQRTNLRSTNTHTHTHKERETEIYEVRRNAYILGIEERSIYDLYKITREFTIDSIKNSLFSHNPRNGFIPLFIERRNPQISSSSDSESAVTRQSADRPVDRSKYAVDRPVDRANIRTYW